MLALTETQKVVVDAISVAIRRAQELGVSIEFDPEDGSLIALNTSDIKDTEIVNWASGERIESLLERGYKEEPDYYSESVKVANCWQKDDDEAEIFVLRK